MYKMIALSLFLDIVTTLLFLYLRSVVPDEVVYANLTFYWTIIFLMDLFLKLFMIFTCFGRSAVKNDFGQQSHTDTDSKY